MTKEQKELLLKDLCARLPYSVAIKCRDEDSRFICYLTSDILREIQNDTCHYDYKPYLFPLSSMTEEQRKEYDSIIYHNVELHADRYYEVIDVDSFEELHDFYHKNHLDYRGLIRMGLAIDATGLDIY